ncbi:MAG: thioredoxin [Clostridiales bacterium]|jgi:thioredoxin 1|nr:thioredoxin [Clostridiales bacterium]
MSEHVTELTGGEFAAFTAEGAALVDFWASWCGPCKAIAPIVEEIAKGYAGKLKVGKVDVDDKENAATAQGFGIMSIPTLLFFKDGKLAEKVVGMRNKAFLTEIIDRLCKMQDG